MKLLRITRHERMRIFNGEHGIVLLLEETRIKYGAGSRQWQWDRQQEEVA
jgi:hypothetical protein